MNLTSESSLADNGFVSFESNLRGQQLELARAIDRAQKGIRALGDSWLGDVIDESCNDASKETMFASYRQSRRQLRNVELALKRISTGEFGICSACGGAIALKRLQAVPWTTNCIECQEQIEQGRAY